MQEDIERTNEALKNRNSNFVYPSMFYFEKPNGDIQSVVFVRSENYVSRFGSSGEEVLNPDHYTTVSDVYRMSIGVQSDLKLFVLNGASKDDINRILDKWSTTKYITPRK